MIEFIVIEIIALVALVYGILLTLFKVGEVADLSLAFLWTLGVALLYAVTFTKHKLFKGLGLLIYLPLFYYMSWFGLVFFVLSGTMILAHIELNVFKQNIDYTHFVKSSYKVFLGLFGLWLFLGMFSDDFVSRNLRDSWPFIMGYLLVSVILVRTQRHMDAGLPLSKIRKSNVLFFFSAMLLLMGLTFEEARKRVLYHVNLAIETTVEFLLRPIYAYFSDYELYMTSEEVELGLEASNEALEHGLEVVDTAPPLFDELMNTSFGWTTVMAEVVEKVLYVLVVLLVIYALIRLSRKIYKRNVVAETGETEERTFISNPEKKKLKALLKGMFSPKTPIEHIRHYYKRHLSTIERLGEPVEASNTSADVLIKASKCGIQSAETIRAIYIEARYAKGDISSEQMEQMKKITKN